MQRFTVSVRFLILIALGVTAGLAVGCSTPTAPPTAPTLSSLVISGPAQPAVVGQPMQLTATAILSNGTTRDVTTQAAWRSPDIGVATVTATGVLTFLTDNCVYITATYQQLSADRDFGTSDFPSPCNQYDASRP